MTTEYFFLFKFKLFFEQTKFNKYLFEKAFSKKNSSSYDLITFYYNKAPHFFNHDTYIILLQAAIVRKDVKIANFILNSQFSYNGQGISQENEILNKAFCKGIYSSNHPAWLFLMSTHNGWELINNHPNNHAKKIEQDELANEHFYHLSKEIFVHPKLKSFLNETTTQAILEHCHPNKVPMIHTLLLDLNLLSKPKPINKKPLKI